MLAVREHPNVQQAQLNEVIQKFNLEVQQWQFKPHYTLQATGTTAKTVTGGMAQGSHNWSVQPATTLLTPIGTQITLSMNNPETSHYNPSLSAEIMQPLMQGFGQAVVQAALYNAMDSEKIACLNIENTLRTIVTGVISAYINVVSAERAIEIDKQAVERAKLSIEQTRLFIKAGRKAGYELVTVEANWSSAKTQLENDKNNLMQARYALLQAIGIDPNTPVHITTLDIPKLINKYHLPTLEQSQKLILENDIQYQIDQITLHGSTTRALLVAEDNTRWQLNLTVNAATGNGAGGGENAGLRSLVNGQNQSRSASLSLQIPIDDKTLEQAVMNAKIALKQAEIALVQEKWNKETNAINGWNAVESAKRALKFAEEAEVLQAKTYKLNYQKYLHGLIDSLMLQTAQLQLISAQQTLLSARIAYLNALVNLDLLTGNTLKTWDIKVRL